MTAQPSGRMRVGLVGAGWGGSALFDLLVTWPDTELCVVVDARPDAPALVKARTRGIPTATSHLDVFRYPVDLLFELTGQAGVLDDLMRLKPAGVEVIGAGGLRFFWDVLETKTRVNDQLRSLADLAHLISQSLDLHEVGRRVVDSVRVLLDADASALYRLEPVSGDLIAVAVAGAVGSTFGPHVVFPRGTGVAGRAVQELRPVVTPDLLEDPRIVLSPDIRTRVEAAPFRAVLAVPLEVKDAVIGALAVAARKGRVFHDDEIRLTQTFANHAALALENARFYDAARHTRDFLQSIAENSADAIVTTDVKGRITYFSPGAEEMFGWAGSEVLGRPVADFYPGGRDEARAVMTRLRHEARVRNHETAFWAKDGRWVAVNASMSTLRDHEGGTVGTLGVMKDVTERKQLEDQLRQSQKMEAIGRLAGGVAHDFNNLLMVIVGRADLLLDALAVDHPLRRHVTLIQKTADRGAALVQQLLAFSRKQVLQPRVLDLNTLVENMEKLLRRLIGEHIELITVLKPGGASVKADPTQLEQAVLNLVVNARDAMPNGGRLVIETAAVELDPPYARRHRSARPGRHVMLAVSDTGVGMDAETQSHLFEPFFTTKPPGEGTGLGLATVYGIVKQSGGNIWVYSEPGLGATFKIYLPHADEPAQVVEPSRSRPALPAGSETVLLVEDEEEVRSVAREMLEREGYTVLEARQGAEALELAQRHPGPIHLLVTDVVMPLVGGRELVDRLGELRRETRVLYMSGHSEHLVIAERSDGGGVAFLQKPFRGEALARKVREVLDRSPRAPH
jgi:PAS domain S-box-containing protein